ncbi:MAG: hypothetical protein ACI395_09535, partial [Candidatus Cryptobacteroides sp.]
GEYLRTKTNLDPCPAGYMIPLATDWAASTEEFEARMTSYGDPDNPIGWDYTFNGEVSWFPCGNCNRQDYTGQLIRGFGGTTMLWNASLYDFGPINREPEGILSNLFPTRWCFVIDSDAMHSIDVPSNPSFAIGVRCMKIRETGK